MGRNCIDISNDKLTRFYTRRPGHGKEKGNLLRETESLLLVKTIAIRINYIKAKMDNTQ